MRPMREATYAVSWPSLRNAHGMLLGLPFVLAACAPAVRFGWSACVAGLLVASLANFLVYLPLTALALNNGNAIREDQPAPRLTARAYATLLALWAVTSWFAAALVPQIQ